MDNLIYLFAGIALLFILLHFFSKERQIAKRFKSTERSNYTSLKDTGVVHVYGRTKLIEELVTPLSQVKCCYYECSVFEINELGKDDAIKNEANWSILKKEVKCTNFLLEVDLEPILVINKNARVLIKDYIDTHSEQFFDTSEYESYWPNIKIFLERHGFRISNIYDKNDKRIKESFIGNDKPLAIIGSGKWLKTADFPEIREFVSKDEIYVLSGTEKAPLLLTNHNSLLWG
jgi:hypothetical protein